MRTAQVRETFDAHAREFDAWFGENKELYLSELDALRAAGPRGNVLDVGVGSGAFASKLGVQLGVDVSRGVLELSRGRGLPVVQGDATQLPIRDNTFDTVVISFTICFVDDAMAMLKEASRVMKEDGRLLLGEITLDSSWGRLYAREGRKGHPFYSRAKFFTLAKTLALLSRAGFRTGRAYGSVSFGPTDEPKAEKAVRVDLNASSAGRYGFVCLRASKGRTG